jgi:hypothetical protein
MARAIVAIEVPMCEQPIVEFRLTEVPTEILHQLKTHVGRYNPAHAAADSGGCWMPR